MGPTQLGRICDRDGAAVTEPAHVNTVRNTRSSWKDRGAFVLRFFSSETFFLLLSAAAILFSVSLFARTMLGQTAGTWSAPLDDTFIHFNYARSIREGHPFEWISGNGFSSGNTSLSYPFVLALGYLVGFKDETLMVWALLIAALSTLLLVANVRATVLHGLANASPPTENVSRSSTTRDLVAPLSLLLLPLLLVFNGGLAWSLWSGMEVAWFLALWSYAFRLFGELSVANGLGRKRALRKFALFLPLLFLTRPETVTCVGIYALALLAARDPQRTAIVRIRESALVASPTFFMMVAQAAILKTLTGSSQAAGALVKILWTNPWIPTWEKWDDYQSNLRFAVWRSLEKHLATHAPLSVFVFFLAALAFTHVRTRKLAAILLAQCFLWFPLVALNGQIRWQNERYTMPAFAWFLLLVPLGLFAALSLSDRAEASPTFTRTPSWLRNNFALGLFLLPPFAFFFVEQIARLRSVHGDLSQLSMAQTLPNWTDYALLLAGVALLSWVTTRSRWIRGATAAGALSAYFFFHEPGFRGQVWFYGRAARNIYDQHFSSADYLRSIGAKRVALSDAGALVFRSHRPAIDLMGLGGYKGLPFALAVRDGPGAILELLERIPPRDRPDVLAWYPSWWGSLPSVLSGTPLRSYPAEGNVICGAYEDVISAADWTAMDFGRSLESTAIDPRPETKEVTTTLMDQIDVGDLVSERAHQATFSPPIVPPSEPTVIEPRAAMGRTRIDVGRLRPPGSQSRFTLRLEGPRDGALRLRIRMASPTHARVELRANGVVLGTIAARPSGRWGDLEHTLLVPEDVLAETILLELTNEGPGHYVHHHLWLERGP